MLLYLLFCFYFLILSRISICFFIILFYFISFQNQKESEWALITKKLAKTHKEFQIFQSSTYLCRVYATV